MTILAHPKAKFFSKAGVMPPMKVTRLAVSTVIFFLNHLLTTTKLILMSEVNIKVTLPFP